MLARGGDPPGPPPRTLAPGGDPPEPSPAVLARGDDPPEPPARALAPGDDPPEPSTAELARGDGSPEPPAVCSTSAGTPVLLIGSHLTRSSVITLIDLPKRRVPPYSYRRLPPLTW